MAIPTYFVVRTDLEEKSGVNNYFGAFYDEASAVAAMIDIASDRYGEFAVVGPAPTAINCVREGGIQAVQAVPVS